MSIFRLNLGAEETWSNDAGEVWLPVPIGRTTSLPESQGEVVIAADGSVEREQALPLFPAQLSGVMRTEIFGLKSIQISIQEGHYTLRLYVGETFEAFKGWQRKFRLAVQGDWKPEIIAPIEIAGGFARAGVITVQKVKVAKGSKLTLEFDGTGFNSKPILYGLVIETSLESESGKEAEASPLLFEALAPQAKPTLPSPSHNQSLRFFIAGHSGIFHWGILETLQRMIAWHHQAISVELDLFAAGGKDAAFFAQAREVDTGLSTQPAPHYAVLMDSSWGPIEHPDVFEEWMPVLLEKVHRASVQPILYAYSGPARFTGAQRRELMGRYLRVGKAAGARVIPCASALVRAEERFPGTNFHSPDRHHIGLLTGFLFASVWYRSLTGESASTLPEHSILGGYVNVPTPWVGPLIQIADETCAEFPVTPLPELKALRE